MAKSTLLRIVRPNETFFVNERNQIFRTRPGNETTPSDDWKLLGAVEFGRGKNSESVIKHYCMADIRLGRVVWTYKNGKQKAFYQQYDHGVISISMSPCPYYIIKG
jgi:hypothetical protein